MEQLVEGDQKLIEAPKSTRFKFYDSMLTSRAMSMPTLLQAAEYLNHPLVSHTNGEYSFQEWETLEIAKFLGTRCLQLRASR